jgi:PAS domain S-box-containing protein
MTDGSLSRLSATKFEPSWVGLTKNDPLRLMVDSVTDYAILWLDTDGAIRSWNPGAERIKGYKAEEIVGQSFSVFYPRAAVAAGIPQNELRVAARDGRFEDEGWRIRKDGSQFWANVIITSLRDERGLLVGFAKLTRDLTERKAAEQELAEANAMVTSVLESTSDAVIQVDWEWSIIYKNRRAAERLPEYRLRRKLWDCYPGLNETEGGHTLRGGMESRTETQVELYFAARDEWYSVSAYPSERGQSLFLRDITREKVLALELREAQIMREKRIELLSHLAGGLAHEISNPLAIMHAAASDLKFSAMDGKSVSAAEVDSASEQIMRTADRALAILRGLQAFTREASRDPMAPASIYRIAQGCVDLQQSRFERHRVELRLTAEAGIPPILCREVQVSQIVTNLITNGFDAIHNAGSVERWVSIAVTVVDDHVCLEAINSGPGVPVELRPRLMEPFFTTKESSGGTGIGLSLSRGIAQDHGGELLFCEVDGRTCFRLLLPIRREERLAAAGEMERKGGHDAIG